MRQLYVYECKGIKKRLDNCYAIIKGETGREIVFVKNLSELEKNDIPLMVFGSRLEDYEFWKEVKDYLGENPERRTFISMPLAKESELKKILGNSPNLTFHLTQDKHNDNILEELAK